MLKLWGRSTFWLDPRLQIDLFGLGIELPPVHNPQCPVGHSALSPVEQSSVVAEIAEPKNAVYCRKVYLKKLRIGSFTSTNLFSFIHKSNFFTRRGSLFKVSCIVLLWIRIPTVLFFEITVILTPFSMSSFWHRFWFVFEKEKKNEKENSKTNKRKEEFNNQSKKRNSAK